MGSGRGRGSGGLGDLGGGWGPEWGQGSRRELGGPGEGLGFGEKGGSLV